MSDEHHHPDYVKIWAILVGLLVIDGRVFGLVGLQRR